MKIKIEFTIDIDADQYAFEYGIKGERKGRQVREEIKATVQKSTLDWYDKLDVLNNSAPTSMTPSNGLISLGQGDIR
tara:strand:+ start:655 stop:885 length:231 start_codon:yes stop_codon:yes gene_type:complete